MIAQIAIFKAYGKYDENNLKKLFHDFCTIHISKQTGFISGQVMKKKDGVWHLLFYFDTETSAINSLTNFTNWSRIKEFDKYTDYSEVKFYNYEVIETINPKPWGEY